ncbi:MAG: hypothetical protein KF796_08725 [Ramlibacter sp.]|nr:hypothetical protein [Ramlibacter sp.]
MDLIVNGLMALVFGVPAVLAMAILVATVRLARIALRSPTLRIVPRDAIPPEIRAALDAARPELEALGFRYRLSTAQESFAVAQGDTLEFTDAYQHADGRTHAHVSRPSLPSDPDLYRVAFTSLVQGCPALMTTNCRAHESIIPPPNADLQDRYLPNWQESWAFHQARLAQLKGTILTDGDTFLRADQEMTETLLPHGQRLGLVHRDGEHWYMNLRAAVRYAIRWNLGQRRVARAHAMRPPSPPAVELPAGAGLTAVARLETDVAQYEKHLALQRSLRWSGRRKWQIFSLSALLFLGIGSLWISWTFLPILLAVIALHEGGHFLAMKLSGYGNLSVFFVPGLGGLASGEKPSAGPWEKLLVYLAGPLPGIALAVAGLLGMMGGWFVPPPWFLELLVACLVINYLNLLPITPLDGGRVVETFLFARLPTARFVFAVLGVLALLAMGISTSDPVLQIVGALVGLSLPHQWRVMRVDRAIVRQPGETLGQREAMEHVFAALQRPAFARWNGAQRINVVAALLPELQGRRPRALEAITGMAIYLLVLAAPIGLAVQAFPGGWTSVALTAGLHPSYVPDDVDPTPGRAQPAAPEPDWIVQADRIETVPPPQRLQVLLQAAEQAESRDDGERRSRYARSAWALAQEREPGDIDRAQALLLTADSESGPQGDLRLRQLVQELQGSSASRAQLLLARAKERLAYLHELPAHERVTLREQVLVHYDAARVEPHMVDSARLSLARAYHESNQFPQAEAELRRRIDAQALPPQADRSMQALNARVSRTSAETDLAWFLIDRGRVSEASQLLQTAAARVPRRVSNSWQYPNRQVHEAWVWAQLQQSDAASLERAWRRYEDSRTTNGRGPNLLHEVDRLIVARAVRDASMESEARAAIAQVRAGPQGRGFQARYCRAPDSETWRRLQHAARADAARSAGLCPRT